LLRGSEGISPIDGAIYYLKENTVYPVY